MGRVTWPVRVTYLPPLSLGAYKSGLSPHLGAPSGSSSGPVTASAHRVVSSGEPARHVETGLRRVGAGC